MLAVIVWIALVVWLGLVIWSLSVVRAAAGADAPPPGGRVREGVGASAPAAALTTESDHTTSPNQTTSAIQTITGSNLVRTPVRAQSGPGLS